MVKPKALGLAGGVFLGASVLIFTFINMYTGYAPMWAALLIDIYPGYSVDFLGALIGLVYGFIGGFIILFIIAWLYNKCNCKGSDSC